MDELNRAISDRMDEVNEPLFPEFHNDGETGAVERRSHWRFHFSHAYRIKLAFEAHSVRLSRRVV